MKILLLNALDIYGGGEFFVYQFASLLKKNGHNVWVSCRPDNPIRVKCEKEGIEVFPLDYPTLNKRRLIKISRALTKLIKENRIDLIHSNTNYDRTAGAFAARLSGAAHVTTNHSFHSIQYNLTHWFRNRYLTDHFIVDGQCTKDLLLKSDKLLDDKITLIHLGIEPVTMKRDELLRKEIRKFFNVKDEELLIGNVGRMVEFKGQEYLLRAFSKINEKFDNVKLMIAGSGKLEDYLHQLASGLGIQDKVIFPGFRDDMQAIYSAFDIYAHTSVEGGGETFPYACLYALAQELPLVVTRVGDVPAMVKESVNGFVVDDRKPELIAEKLSVLIQDEKLRTRMGKESLNLLHLKFTDDAMLRKIESVYIQAIEKNNQRRKKTV
jgi:glycosyltransferase involved in cell wall biosynthesis